MVHTNILERLNLEFANIVIVKKKGFRTKYIPCFFNTFGRGDYFF